MSTLARPARVPPRALPLLDHTDVLGHKLVPRLGVALGVQPAHEGDHLVRPPPRAREEKVGEPCRRVRAQRVHGEVLDQLALGGRSRWGVAEQVRAAEEVDGDVGLKRTGLGAPVGEQAVEGAGDGLLSACAQCLKAHPLGSKEATAQLAHSGGHVRAPVVANEVAEKPHDAT